MRRSRTSKQRVGVGGGQPASDQPFELELGAVVAGGRWRLAQAPQVPRPHHPILLRVVHDAGRAFGQFPRGTFDVPRRRSSRHAQLHRPPAREQDGGHRRGDVLVLHLERTVELDAGFGAVRPIGPEDLQVEAHDQTIAPAPLLITPATLDPGEPWPNALSSS
jgi:hypothetical protein